MRLTSLLIILTLLSCSNSSTNFDPDLINGLWMQEFSIPVIAFDSTHSELDDEFAWVLRDSSVKDIGYTFIKRDSSIITVYYDGDTSRILVDWINDFQFKPIQMITGSDTLIADSPGAKVVFVDEEILVLELSITENDTLKRVK